MKPAAVLLASAALATAKPTVYFIRHGEKPADGSTGLSPQGQQRAQCLRGVFGASSQYNIGYIMAETPSKDGSHDRPYETVAPLAADLGITVDTSCDEKDAKCVKKAVEKYSGPGNILIAWEHGHLTDLVAKLGDDNAPTYPDDHFDLIWTDPYPYTSISSTTSEHCAGLDN